jgi:hypothetical protein
MSQMEEGNMTRDRKLIGRIIEREMRRNPNLGSWTALERASRVSRSTLYRAKDGDPRVETPTFERIEAALDLPYETLATAGMHDFDGLLELGVAPALVAWIRKDSVKSETIAPDVAGAM